MIQEGKCHANKTGCERVQDLTGEKSGNMLGEKAHSREGTCPTSSFDLRPKSERQTQIR